MGSLRFAGAYLQLRLQAQNPSPSFFRTQECPAIVGSGVQDRPAEQSRWDGEMRVGLSLDQGMEHIGGGAKFSARSPVCKDR